MYKSTNDVVYLLVLFVTTFLMPSSSLAGGFLDNMLNKAAGSVVNNIDSTVSQHIGSTPQASGQNASPTQQVSGQNASPTQQVSGQHQNGSHNETPVNMQNPPTSPKNSVALKGAFYKDYKYSFSGKLNLRLSGFKSKSYKGWVISGGAPDYKIKSFNLDIGGLTSGWVLSHYQRSTPNYWQWDRPEGSLRVHVTIATPLDKLPSPGAATINIFGTFMGNYTFSTSNNLTTTPVGPPSFADKITMKTNGAIYMAHYLRTTAAPVSAAYPGVSLDILGIKPGMSLEAVKRILVTHYKSRPRSIPQKARLSYKGIVYLSSQPYVSQLVEQKKDGSDRIAVIFGNPVIGNTVIGVVRILQFSGSTAPEISQLMLALKNKYGPETVVNIQNWAASGHDAWFFGKHGLIKSSSTGACPTVDPVGLLESSTGVSLPATGAADFDNFTPYSSGPNKTGSTARKYACVEAEIAPLTGDESRADWLTLSLYSIADAELSNEAAMQQMHAAVVVDYKRVVKPEQVPTL